MSQPRPYPGMPRWVKVVGIVAVALALAFVILHLTGQGLGSHMHHGVESR